MKTNKLALSCALAAATALLAFADECVVLRPGEVEVVLPAKPLPIERFAADELTNFLSRVIGAPVPVIEARSNGTDSVAILLGRAAGFDVSAFERDAFRTKVERSSDGAATIRIAGRDGNADLFRYVWKYGQPTHHERATLFGDQARAFHEVQDLVFREVRRHRPALHGVQQRWRLGVHPAEEVGR